MNIAENCMNCSKFYSMDDLSSCTLWDNIFRWSPTGLDSCRPWIFQCPRLARGNFKHMQVSEGVKHQCHVCSSRREGDDLWQHLSVHPNLNMYKKLQKSSANTMCKNFLHWKDTAISWISNRNFKITTWLKHIKLMTQRFLFLFATKSIWVTHNQTKGSGRCQTLFVKTKTF